MLFKWRRPACWPPLCGDRLPGQPVIWASDLHVLRAEGSKWVILPEQAVQLMGKAGDTHRQRARAGGACVRVLACVDGLKGWGLTWGWQAECMGVIRQQEAGGNGVDE